MIQQFSKIHWLALILFCSWILLPQTTVFAQSQEATQAEETKETKQAEKPHQQEKVQQIRGMSLDEENEEARAKIYAQLKEKTNIQFVDTPISDVLDYLMAEMSIPIVVKHKAFEEEGSSPRDSSITLQPREISFEHALNLILNEFDATWYVENGVLIVSTKTEEEYNLKTKVYKISPLIQAENHDEMAALARQVILTITGTINPDSWSTVGGPGSLTVWRETLIIKASPRTHDQIERLFQTLLKLNQDQSMGFGPGEITEGLFQGNGGGGFF
ncbi:Hypothetical protein PBC10988_15100 [Planctomycetales bacterium 10988]|nr:Hypothetical protein PBC10988_15100 [Planctomycetales bacterium 10988]